MKNTNILLTAVFIFIFLFTKASLAINFGMDNECTSAQMDCETEYLFNKYGNYWDIWEMLLRLTLLVLIYFVVKYILSKIFNTKKDADNKEKVENQERKIKAGLLTSKIMIFFIISVLFFFNYIIIDRDCKINSGEICVITGLKKPVIYLYPEEKTEVHVQLDFNGKIIADYPRYNEELKGWKVVASPDSTLINSDDGKEYQSLFWEGETYTPIDWDLSTGFVVEGKDVREFLQEKLFYMGLTPKEYNEFILFWYPIMMNNDYNLVHFAQEQYTDEAPLKITPEPDSMLRVFMITKATDEKVDIIPQKLEQFERTGFAVVEWGGSDIK